VILAFFTTLAKYSDVRLKKDLDFNQESALLITRFDKLKYGVSPIIRPSVIFEDDFNISPTLEISPS